MRHSVFGRKLSRTKNERKRLLQGLVRNTLRHGSIKTSVAKAKAVRPMMEKLITLAKKGSAREVKKILADKQMEKELLADAKTRFASRTSGFTRIIRLGGRPGDATEEVLFQLVDEKVIADVVTPKQAGAKKQKTRNVPKNI